jgi:hypothetical protein
MTSNLLGPAYRKLRAFLRHLPHQLLAGGLLNLPTGSVADPSKPNEILPSLAERIAEILLRIAYPLAFIGIIYSVYLLVVNSGNPDAFKTTKKNVGFIVTGILLLIFALFIFNKVVKIFT